MKINFYHDPNGQFCNRCGRTINNIFEVSDENNSFVLGCECINKITNISEYGLKVIKKYQRAIKKDEQTLNDFLTRDYDIISKKHFSGCYGNEYNPLTGETKQRNLEEFKNHIELKISGYTKMIQKQIIELNKMLVKVKINN